jgi:phage host-nuclease inhibitor protein Gam
MEIRGVKKLETSLGNISIRKTPPSVNVLDENLIPLEYIETKQVMSIDKKLILGDLKDGLVIPGVEIKQGTSLTIK